VNAWVTANVSSRFPAEWRHSSPITHHRDGRHDHLVRRNNGRLSNDHDDQTACPAFDISVSPRCGWAGALHH